MTAEQIAGTLSDRFGGKIRASLPNDKHPRVHVDAADWLPIAEFLHGEPSLKLDWLQCLSGLWSFDHRHGIAVKAFCPRNNPRFPSVARLWSAADWQEREAFDMFGIVFDGHPDLRRILCADDWEGFPLLKDYVFPREYHGIPASVELDWQQKPDYPQGHV